MRDDEIFGKHICSFAGHFNILNHSIIENLIITEILIVFVIHKPEDSVD